MVHPSKAESFRLIQQLVERFHEHRASYTRAGYNEHQTRIDFINPFFKALGWDMDNEQGLAELGKAIIKAGGTLSDLESVKVINIFPKK